MSCSKSLLQTFGSGRSVHVDTIYVSLLRTHPPKSSLCLTATANASVILLTYPPGLACLKTCIPFVPLFLLYVYSLHFGPSVFLTSFVSLS